METKKSKNLLKEELPRVILLLATLIVFVFFGIVQPKFFNLGNIFNILQTASIVGVMSLGVMISLSCGELNFAAGSTAAIAATIVGKLAGDKIDGMVIPIIIALLACLLISFVSAVAAFRVGIPSFIATLGVSRIIDGLCKLFSGNKTIFSKTWPDTFTYLGQGRIGVVPVSIVMFIVILLIVWLLMEKTSTGKYIEAIGTNSISCQQVGINVTRMKFIAFAISSILCGFSGIMFVSKMNSVGVLAGSDMLMNAIASAILGATFLRIGRFNVWGSALSVILLTAIQNGVVSIGAPSPVKSLVQGIILIVAVGIIALVRKGGLPNVSIGS